MALSPSAADAMPIIAISQPRLAIMAHMRWAMKPGESLISVTLAPVRARMAAAASRTRSSAPGAVMMVRRLAMSPVRSIATVRRGSRPRSTTVVVQSLPIGATRIGLRPAAAPRPRAARARARLQPVPHPRGGAALADRRREDGAAAVVGAQRLRARRHDQADQLLVV